MSAFSKKREVESALMEKLPVLMYKNVYFTNNLYSFLRCDVVSLLQEFVDVFSEEIAYGLPPLRCIEHQIDFIPSVSLPNRPTYRSRLEEAKKIQRQVYEFLQKEIVRERWDTTHVCRVPSHK